MRPLPPTLRDRRRYLLARVVPHWRVHDGRQMYQAISEAATSLWGDAVCARMQPAVISCEKGYLVVRCLRGTEGWLETALATVTCGAEGPIALRTIATSGTLQALRKRMKPLPPVREEGEVILSEGAFARYPQPGQKVDLIEKGIKNQKSLFFTQTEVEEF
jgi:ribonuclease P/MRP protein subunit POP5